MAALFSRIAGRLPKHGRDVAVELVLYRMGSCGWPVATTCNLAWAERGTRGGRWGAPARARCLWRTRHRSGSPCIPRSAMHRGPTVCKCASRPARMDGGGAATLWMCTANEEAGLYGTRLSREC